MKKILLGVALISLLCILVIRFVLFDWAATDFRYPLVYSQDDVYTASFMQGMMEGDYHPFQVSRMKRLSAPTGLEFGDYPITDSVHLCLIKVLSWFSSNVFQVYNVYYLLTFLFCAFGFYGVARAFNLNEPISIALSVVFSFSQYHETRYQHLFMSGFFMVPAMLWVVLRFWDEKPLLDLAKVKAKGWRGFLDQREFLICAAILAVSGGCGAYYVMFTLFLGGMASVHAAAHFRSLKRFYGSSVVLGVLLASFAASTAPYLLFRLQNGKNSVVAVRPRSDTEAYGLSLMPALFPMLRGNSVPLVTEKIAKRYKSRLPGSEVEYLGAWASLGFIIALAVGLLGRRRTVPNLLDRAGWLAVFATLYSLRGGFAHLISVFITPQIRVPSRMVVFMGPIGLLAMGFVLTWLIRRMKWRGLATGVLALVILAFGIPDQLHYHSLSNQLAIASVNTDRAFVQKIESALSPGASVLQLPLMLFPEVGGLHKIVGYDPLKFYLLSHDLRWSGGAVMEREAFKILQSVAASPLRPDAVKTAGFSGIVVDSFGYEDEGRAVQQDLRAKLPQAQFITSPNGRYLFVAL